jgi:hypothetical protein
MTRRDRRVAASPAAESNQHGYAVIGGETHTYQRYPVELEDGRTIHYVVSGGGGAYLSGTHDIGRIDVHSRSPSERIREDEVHFYPLAGTR